MSMMEEFLEGHLCSYKYADCRLLIFLRNELSIMLNDDFNKVADIRAYHLLASGIFGVVPDFEKPHFGGCVDLSGHAFFGASLLHR